jgi:hypothetical protein
MATTKQQTRRIRMLLWVLVATLVVGLGACADLAASSHLPTAAAVAKAKRKAEKAKQQRMREEAMARALNEAAAKQATVGMHPSDNAEGAMAQPGLPRAGLPAAAVAPGSTQDSPVCKTWGTPQVTGTVGKDSLDEISGLAVSRRHPGLLWVHNDAGNQTRLYLLSPEGKVRASLKVPKQPQSDWEDVAVGPCSTERVLGSTPCVYVSDTGDNKLTRGFARIVRVPEPPTLDTHGDKRTVAMPPAAIEQFTFRYPDGPQDIEAMAVLPDTRVILLSKRTDGRSYVYRVSLKTGGDPVVAERLGVLSTSGGLVAPGTSLRVTAADLSPDGKFLLVRTSARVLLFDLGTALAGPADAAEEAFAAAVPRHLPTLREAQGEAIGWDTATGGFWQISEGEGADIVRVACTTR